MLKRSGIVLFILLFSAPAFADIPGPNKTPKGPKKVVSIDTNLQIKLDGDAKEARLIIPRDQIKELRAQLDSIEQGQDTAASGFSNIQTIVSGSLFSIAFVFAGVWLVRSGKLSGKASRSAAAAGCIAIGLSTVAVVVYGNAGPPPEARSITGKMFSRAVHIYKFGGGRIRLEVSDEEKTPKLIVPDPPDAPKENDE